MSEQLHISDDDRRYLAVLEELDGSASSSEIRERTGFSTDQINYRHKKLKNSGIVTIEKDDSLTPPDVSPMKVATLTDKGQELVAKGETVEAEIEETTEERLDRHESEIDELKDTMDGAFPWLNEFAARVRRLEAFIEDKGGDLDEFGDIEDYYDR